MDYGIILQLVLFKSFLKQKLVWTADHLNKYQTVREL
jgi:hypothetical protein